MQILDDFPCRLIGSHETAKSRPKFEQWMTNSTFRQSSNPLGGVCTESCNKALTSKVEYMSDLVDSLKSGVQADCPVCRKCPVRGYLIPERNQVSIVVLVAFVTNLCSLIPFFVEVGIQKV